MNNAQTLKLIGILFILGGLLSLAIPLRTTLAQSRIIDWTILAIGIVTLMACWRIDTWKERFVLLVIGALVTFIGWSLLANPFVGILRLSILVSILFLLAGAFKIFAAIWFRPRPRGWIVVASGVVSLLLGLMGLVGFPFSAAVTLGIFLTVALLSDGIAILAFAARGEPRHSDVQAG